MAWFTGPVPRLRGITGGLDRIGQLIRSLESTTRLQLFIDPRMQPVTESDRQFEDPIIGNQHHYVSGRVEHCRTDLAGLKVFVDVRTQVRIHLAVNIG